MASKQAGRYRTPFIARDSGKPPAKAVSEAIKHISSKIQDKRGRHRQGRIREHQSKGLVANRRAAEVARVVGGKTGGKGATSAGNGTDSNKVEKAVEAAVTFLPTMKDSGEYGLGIVLS
ncbi:MAG: hypothetical protein Q9173_000132 [Seirophora scorigena]